jgi:type VI secretion system protein VasD
VRADPREHCRNRCADSGLSGYDTRAEQQLRIRMRHMVGGRRCGTGAGGLFMAALVVAGVLGSCGGPPPPPPPTVIEATVSATGDVNADAAGTGAPVVIRIYQLVSGTSFKGATFFPLFEKDAATLKDDLVKREELLLAPGQTKTMTLLPEDRAHVIGVFAAYRDYEHLAWSGTVDIPAHQTSTLTVKAGHAGLELAIQPAKAPPR